MTQDALVFPPHQPVATSRAAAASIRGRAAPIREHVYGFLWARGQHGATDEEIAETMGLSGNTARPRRIELEKAGRILYAHVERSTRSGRKARVYVVVEDRAA